MARVSGANLLMASGTLLAVGVLLSQVGSPQELWDTIKSASWGWVAAAFLLSMATKLGYAIALIGAVPNQLPLWPATETQIGMAFANLAAPFVGQLAMFCLALVLSPASADFGNISAAAVVEFLMLVIIIVGVASVVVLGVGRFRRAALPPIRRGSAVIWQGLRSPRRAMLLVL